MCQEAEVCGPAQMVARLRSVAVLRREADPDPDLLLELFRYSVAKFSCHACDHLGLQLQEVATADWDTVRMCSVCGGRIPSERLELFPTAQRCARCETAADNGPERDFCPKCGEVLTTRLRRGAGIAKYELSCPRCRN